jgi:hypothetical protein
MRTALTTLKIAVLAPIPRARARTATKVRPRLRKSIRRPKANILEDVEHGWAS